MKAVPNDSGAADRRPDQGSPCIRREAFPGFGRESRTPKGAGAGLLLALFGALALPAQEVTAPARESTLTTAESSPSPRTPTESARSGSPSAPAVNPLAGYLADWMRPRDRALLRKDATAPTGTEAWWRLGTAGSAPRKPAPKPAPTANPYIDAMNTAAATAATTTGSKGQTTPVPPAGLEANPVAAPASLAEPEAPPPPAPTRYQPPPSSDPKYFPQLKRF